MTREEAEKIMQPWCSNDGTRAALLKPCVLDGWLYATDGRRCIRTATDALDNCHLSLINGLRGLKFGITDERPWPNPVVELEDGPCDECGGFGKECETCMECHGEGEVTCYACLHDHECDKCRGQGTLLGSSPCKACAGTGKAKYPLAVRIAGKVLGGKYVQDINNVPGDKVFTMEHPGQFTIHTTDGRFSMIVCCIRED